MLCHAGQLQTRGYVDLRLSRPPPGPVDWRRIRRRILCERPHPPSVPIRPDSLLPPLLAEVRARPFPLPTFNRKMGTVPDFRRPCENSGTVLFFAPRTIADAQLFLRLPLPQPQMRRQHRIQPLPLPIPPPARQISPRKTSPRPHHPAHSRANPLLNRLLVQPTPATLRRSP